MIKLSFLETKIIENGPATICIMKCVLRKPNEVLGGAYPLLLSAEILKKYGLYYDGSFQVSSRVTKSPEDQEKDNPEIARRLAESKAKRKAYSKAKKILNDYAEYILDLYLSGCDDADYKLATLIETEDKHIEKLKNEI